MSYRIEPGEAPGPAVRRIAGEQCESALADLRNSGQPIHWRVHELRRSCKKIRAVVRLIRPGFERYSDVNAQFRDIARRLSAHRNARIVTDLVADLVGDDAADHPAARWYRTRCEFAEAHATALLPDIEESVAEAAFGVEHWDVAAIMTAHVAGGLEMTLCRARRCYQELNIGASSRAFHEWRKLCKYHSLHLCLLEIFLPKSDAGRYAQFHEAESLIGDEHDCTVLVEDIMSQPAYVRESFEFSELLAAAMRRKRQLRRKVLRHAEALFSEDPAHFAQRIGNRWDKAAEVAIGRAHNA